MTGYHGKVIELVAIEKCNEKSYLHIKFFFEQQAELFWEIDSDTAEKLKTITEFDENHKYRLSLHTKFDAVNKQYTSFITRTYLDKSDRIYFDCSLHYKNNLESIKNTQSLNDLNRLKFISIDPLAMDDEKIKQKNRQNNLVVSKKYNLPLKLIMVAMIGVIFFILFGYSKNLNVKHKTIKKTITLNSEVETTKVNLENKKNIVTPITNLANDYSTQSSLPEIELNNLITFNIPKGYVSLTFDDGPSKYTVEIVDILKKYKVGGTFFFIGYNVKKHPNFVQYVHSNNYSIGSHSMNHVKMSNLSYAKQENEITQSSKAIEDITHEKVVLFRPPYEALNEQTKEIIYNYHDKMILWNRDPKDWKIRDPDKIYNYIRKTEASGSIILLHETQAVVDTLPKIIEHLQEQNLKIISLK
ncbi:polysaccharide deacetylase family protein [Bacillus sp. RG28]|uniref:Polysaccharide deacetylase family protein n=1 Tax=Gottfriedia endophytica TaxID=2820819 RepID=A0A940SIW7_9BACI|nr:polysaccharide deacetylase family protein [Gottfriedia endophytica]MBP0723603.1 polysaccharide deacetylase family protein [Gottfriedia endophytica]